MGRVGFSIAVGAMVALCACAETARGQCTRAWAPGNEIPGQVNGVVYGTVRWDPDGLGPVPESLVIGGQFSSVNDLITNNIAYWDGGQWQSLGEGLSMEVWSVAVFRGELYAGGQYDNWNGTPGQCVSRWDGQRWQPVGIGNEFQYGGYVYEMLEFDDELVVAGEFSLVSGGSTTHNIARWNGTTWSFFGAGLNSSMPNLGVRAMCEFEGSLVVGGNFTFNDAGNLVPNLGRWDGIRWRAMGNGGGLYSTYVRDLVVESGQLFAAGMSGFNGVVSRWNEPTWSVLSAVNGEARCLAFQNAQLYLGGDFTQIIFPISAPAKWLARFDGTSLRPVLAKPAIEYYPQYPGIHRLTEYNGRIAAAGNFSWGEYSPLSASIALWDGGADWKSIGGTTDGYVNAFSKFQGELIVGGWFNQIGGITCRGAARRVGTQWAPLGQGPGIKINAFCEFRGELFAAGNGSSTKCVSRWEGNSWQYLPLPFITGDSNINSLVVVQDKLLAGGSNVQNNIWSWDGVSWQPILLGASNVTDLRVYQDSVYAALGGSPGLLKWNGSTWSTVGGGFLGAISGPRINSLSEHAGSLVVGGMFVLPSSSSGARNLAKWNGALWSAAIPGNSSPDDEVSEVGTLRNELIVFGSFHHIGGQAISRMARMNETGWHPLENGNGVGFTFFDDNGVLLAGRGSLQLAGDRFSSVLFTWGPIDPNPGLAGQPSSPNICAGSSVSLRTTATGDGVLSYHWRKSGVELVDGGEMMGANTDTLVFVHAGVADAGEYDCVVKLNDCTQATSNIATLTVYPTNTADGNGDGTVDGRDVQGMVDALVGFSPVSAALCAYELNGDGIVSEADVEAFVGRVLGS